MRGARSGDSWRGAKCSESKAKVTRKWAAAECIGRRGLDCEADKPSRGESRAK